MIWRVRSAEAHQGLGPAQLEARPLVLPLYPPKDRDCASPGLSLVTTTEELTREGWDHTGGRAVPGCL